MPFHTRTCRRNSFAMCTLTLIQPRSTAPDGWPSSRAIPMLGTPILRLVMNRDELRSRARAIPPAVLQSAQRSILMPVDPASQGTWIGINDCGLFAAVLNLTEPQDLAGSGRFGRSRGNIVPAILQYTTLDQARMAAESLLNVDYSPFRLLIGSWEGACLVHSRARTVEYSSLPLLLTSSGLGDHLVQSPRADLFARTLARDGSAASQDAFHRHVFPAQHQLSVQMEREDARTVSIATLEVSSTSAIMHYDDLLAQQVSTNQLSLSRPTESSAL